jgi:hypothetical protein
MERKVERAEGRKPMKGGKKLMEEERKEGG